MDKVTVDVPELDIRRGVSTSTDPIVAAQELHEAIFNPDASLTLVFCSPDYDLVALGNEIKRLFGDYNIVGCTTAGEITPAGYLEGTVTGVSISGADFHVGIARVDNLREFKFHDGDLAARQAFAQLRSAGTDVTGQNTFGFLLADGLSLQEEALVSAIYRNLGNIQMFGGSAGDGTRFGKTYVYHNGEFRSNAAVFILAHTRQPFCVFKTEHFVPSEEKLVVTRADPERRVVFEINGETAGREYARAVGVSMQDLTPFIFASYPIVVRAGGSTYVRAIQKVNGDESLTFFGAMDEGIVITVAKSMDFLENLTGALDAARAKVGPLQLVLGCDCILRHLEAKQKGMIEQVGAIMRANNVVGFATYGEQINATHVNQTFTALAIGGRATR